MKAPEKVYIDDFGSGFSHGWHTEHSYENDIEYVRKDSFIEKAVEWLNKHWREYVWLTDNDIIHFGHWKNDFKKAMEE